MNAESNHKRELNKLLSKLDDYQLGQFELRMHRIINRKEAHRKITNKFFQFIKSGNYEAVRNFLSDYPDFDINVKDKPLGNTALIYAVLLGHKDTVRLLVNKGANPNISNKVGTDCFDTLEKCPEKDKMYNILTSKTC